MKLYNLARGSRIKAETSNEDGKLGDYIIFHKLDGAFSYCSVEGKPEEICHLSANQELKLNGDYYELN